MLFSFLRFCKEVITVSIFQLVTVFAKNRPSRPSVFLRVPPCPTRMRFATRGPTCNTKQWRHRISAIRSPSTVECACVFASSAHARMRASGSSRVQRSIMYCKILKKKIVIRPSSPVATVMYWRRFFVRTMRCACIIVMMRCT